MTPFFSRAVASAAFKRTIPVMMGYLPMGMAFGVLLSRLGYDWWVAPLMSVVIYAGAAQFLAVGFFSANTSLPEVALTTFFLNSRHLFYGLSLLTSFSGLGKVKPYLIFALTDETYGLLTSEPAGSRWEKRSYFFLMAVLNHGYWILGGMIGMTLGKLLNFDTTGLGFSLTALFVVLALEQYQAKKNPVPFAVAFFTGILALIFMTPRNMLLFAILVSLGLMILIQGVFRRDES